MKFTKKQVVCVVECILNGVLDRLGLPDEITVSDRQHVAEHEGIPLTSLGAYERGALESAGMALGCFAYNAFDDGMGIYDALACCDEFHTKVEQLVEWAWNNHAKVRAALEGVESVHIPPLYEGRYPDTEKCAVAFWNVFKQ